MLGLPAVTAACARGLPAVWLLACCHAPWQEAAGQLQGCPARQETTGEQHIVSTCGASRAVAERRCATARLQATRCWSHQSHADSVGVVLLTLHLGVRVECLTACSCGADSSTQVPVQASAAACHAPRLEAALKTGNYCQQTAYTHATEVTAAAVCCCPRCVCDSAGRVLSQPVAHASRAPR